MKNIAESIIDLFSESVTGTNKRIDAECYALTAIELIIDELESFHHYDDDILERLEFFRQLKKSIEL